MHTVTLVSAVLLVVVYLLYSLYHRYQSSQWLTSIPEHEFDGPNGWQRYRDDYRSLIRSGYAKYSKNGQIFRTKDLDGGWRIIISPQHLLEIKHASNKTLSWQQQMHDTLMMTHTGAPDRPPWSAKVIRMELNRRLANLTDYMVTQINDSFSTILSDDEEQFQQVNILHIFRQAVAQITTRVFSSEQLAHDPEWNESVNRFTGDGFGAALAVRAYSPWLRYPASFFLPAVRRLKEDRDFARRKLGPLYAERLAALKDPDYKAPDDGMQWLIEAGNDDLTLDVLADTMIRIMMAAVHTTAQTSTIALTDLLTRCDLMGELREELMAACKHSNNANDLVQSLPKFESVIKESTRMTPIGIIMVGRKVLRTHVFSDGTQIPAGNSIFSPTEAVNHDPGIYSDPDTFDGLRFHKLRTTGEAGEFHKWMLGNAIEESTGFGYGAQACPGRWFAGREMLLMFAKLVGDYEIRWDPEHSAEPVHRYQERAIKAPTEFYMHIRRRKASDRLFPASLEQL